MRLSNKKTRMRSVAKYRFYIPTLEDDRAWIRANTAIGCKYDGLTLFLKRNPNAHDLDEARLKRTLENFWAAASAESVAGRVKYGVRYGVTTLSRVS